MDIKKVVAVYADKAAGKVEIDLKALAQDAECRNLLVQAILTRVKENPNVCVFIPAYKNRNHLGTLVNELAQTLQVRHIATGSVDNLRRLARSSFNEVILFKQAFNTGAELAGQVSAIQTLGCKVRVLCLAAHSKERLENFATEQGIKAEALVYTEEL